MSVTEEARGSNDEPENGDNNRIAPLFPMRVFIGSSTEGLETARDLKIALEKCRKNLGVDLWSDGVLPLSVSILEGLVQKLEVYDFGIFILSNDDWIKLRAQEGKAPRANVVFELGLFMGGLGRMRSIFCVNAEEGLIVPSDLHGVNFVNLTSGAGLGAAVKLICEHIEVVGRRHFSKKWVNIDEAHEHMYALMQCPSVRSIHLATMTTHRYPNSKAREDFNGKLLEFKERSGFGGIWYLYLTNEPHAEGRRKRADLLAAEGLESNIRFIAPECVKDAPVSTFIILGEEEVVEFVDGHLEPSCAILHAGPSIRNTFKTLFSSLWALGTPHKADRKPPSAQ